MPTTAGAVGAWLGSSGVAAAAATAVVGAAVSQAMAPKPPKQESQAVTAADAPPKAQATVDPLNLAKKNALAASATGSLAGQNSTVLTGSQGINPANLSLGTSSLLGQ